jgi:bis(5'-nucleosyl)-tetraphosphatase (symmetrical)
MSRRVIVYGDIHGCLDELKGLRKNLDLKDNDIEISVGDFINKGPRSIDTLRYIKKNGILSVLGNNEEKLLKYYKKYKKDGKKVLNKLKDIEKEIVLNFKKDDIEFLNSLPYFIKISDLTVVHGGIKRGLKLDNKLDSNEKKSLTTIRYYNKNFEMIPYSNFEDRYKFWSEVYDGRDGFVVYGHQAERYIRVDKFAIGLDTSCVYGGALSAIVFDKCKDTIDTKKYRLYQQPALKSYFC